MDHLDPREADFEVDLESGVRAGVDNSSNGPISVVKMQAKALLAKVGSVCVDGTTKGEEGVKFCANLPNSNGASAEHVKLEGENTVDHGEKKVIKEKHKKKSNKKHPRPPRPPRGPSLDAADLKLIREISELAMLKRARIERMKASKKMKNAKASSSNSSLLAMVFTILVCLVIIFQGMSSRVTSANLQISPTSSRTTEVELISVQYLGNPSAIDLNGPGSSYPISVEPVVGSKPPENLRRAVG